jgi:hypothetical protein
MAIADFWNVTQIDSKELPIFGCNLMLKISGSNGLKDYLGREDGGSKLLRNVANHLPVDML